MQYEIFYLVANLNTFWRSFRMTEIAAKMRAWKLVDCMVLNDSSQNDIIDLAYNRIKSPGIRLLLLLQSTFF